MNKDYCFWESAETCKFCTLKNKCPNKDCINKLKSESENLETSYILDDLIIGTPVLKGAK